MLEKISRSVKKFLEQRKSNKIQIISHHDTDGICSAAIMASALQRLDKDFSVKIIKQLEKEIIESLPKNHLLLFLDLGSGNIEELNKLKNEIYIIDHHEIKKDIELRESLNVINPHLHNEEALCGAGLTYLFVKEMNKDNKDLANLAIMGMVGDMLDKNIGKIGNSIVNDAEMVIKRGLLLYPATRPINKVLEFSSSMFIPGVTGSPTGAINLLRDIGIERKEGRYKNLIELNEDEMSKLITAILLRRNNEDISDFIGNIYLVKFSNRLEDARELSAMINACSRLGHGHISGLNFVSNLKKIEGNNYVIINAKNNIKDTVIGTIASILSMSSVYKEGTIIVTMADSEEKIKISARVAGRKGNGRNIREILDSVTGEVGGESGGHALAAGCLIEKTKGKEFIELLKKRLEIELVKI